MKTSVDPYKVLGLDRGASENEIKKAYFRLVRQHSPERDPEKFKEIRSAYEMLKDERARARADISVLAEPREGLRRYNGELQIDFKPDLEELLGLDEYCDLKNRDFRADWQDISPAGR